MRGRPSQGQVQCPSRWRRGWPWPAPSGNLKARLEPHQEQLRHLVEVQRGKKFKIKDNYNLRFPQAMTKLIYLIAPWVSHSWVESLNLFVWMFGNYLQFASLIILSWTNIKINWKKTDLQKCQQILVFLLFFLYIVHPSIFANSPSSVSKDIDKSQKISHIIQMNLLTRSSKSDRIMKVLIFRFRILCCWDALADFNWHF